MTVSHQTANTEFVYAEDDAKYAYQRRGIYKWCFSSLVHFRCIVQYNGLLGHPYHKHSRNSSSRDSV